LVPPAQTATRTLALVAELIELPLRPLSALTRAPVVESTTYGSPADRLDIYTPAGSHGPRSLPAVVMVLGVHPQEIDSPDVVRIASAISRIGVVVGVADSTDLRATRVTPAEPRHLAEAVLVLAGRPQVDPARVGLAGFSAGASIALVAGADERLDLAWISAHGGYADAETLVVDVATRTQQIGSDVRPWSPTAGIRRDVLEIFLQAIEPPAVRQPLHDVLAPVLADERAPRGPVPAVAARFDGDARVAYEVFTATGRGAAQRALGRASAELREQMAGISPLAFAARIRTPVYLLHGEADDAIGFSHALQLAERLPVVAGFTRFGRFGHGQPGMDGLSLDDAGDIVALTLHLHDIVAAATE
jgi:pimeloyl-ACP methyl ester carboxylesterase